jgi:chromate transporter
MSSAPIPSSGELPPMSAPLFDASASMQPPPNLSDLFLAFVKISLSGFGGVLAWSRRMMVEERHWLTPEQFNEAYALCAFLPGPNIINFSVVFGSRFRGPLGGLVALVGLIGPPMVLVMILGILYAHYGDLPMLRRALIGVASSAAGLMMATVAKMARPLFRNRAVTAPLIALATFVAIGIMHWPLAIVLGVIVPVSIANSWMRR